MTTFKMGLSFCLAVAIVLGAMNSQLQAADKLWCDYEGGEGPGKGKFIVLLSGDHEYRSEEALPQLGKILAVHHGFKCRVLFAIDSKTGEIKPDRPNNFPGIEALKDADLLIIATRFANPPAAQMKIIDDYLKSGKPVIGMRTATHGFQTGGEYQHYKNGYGGDKKEWKGGFGKFILGEKWVNHWGGHKREATGGLVDPGAKDHSIVRGIKDRDVWGDTDVYQVKLPMDEGIKPIILGAILTGMKVDDPIKETKKNKPMMPVGWTKSYQVPGGKKGRVFNTTMGSSSDLVSEGTRRMLVNATYWCVGLEDKIPAAGTKVDIVGEFKPTKYGFGSYTKGVKPADHDLKK
jgi:type 1 glutamine amidotransferase